MNSPKGSILTCSRLSYLGFPRKRLNKSASGARPGPSQKRNEMKWNMRIFLYGNKFWFSDRLSGLACCFLPAWFRLFCFSVDTQKSWKETKIFRFPFCHAFKLKYFFPLSALPPLIMYLLLGRLARSLPSRSELKPGKFIRKFFVSRGGARKFFTKTAAANSSRGGVEDERKKVSSLVVGRHRGGWNPSQAGIE